MRRHRLARGTRARRVARVLVRLPCTPCAGARQTRRVDVDTVVDPVRLVGGSDVRVKGTRRRARGTVSGAGLGQPDGVDDGKGSRAARARTARGRRRGRRQRAGRAPILMLAVVSAVRLPAIVDGRCRRGNAHHRLFLLLLLVDSKVGRTGRPAVVIGTLGRPRHRGRGSHAIVVVCIWRPAWRRRSPRRRARGLRVRIVWVSLRGGRRPRVCRGIGGPQR